MNSSPHKENEVALTKKIKKDGKAVEKETKKAIARGQSKSCHQCRQSIFSGKGIVEAKQGQARVKCGQCTRYWCDKCLRNRYGLVLTSLDPASWTCPFCMKNCNCSICRKKEGKLATGILTPLAKNAGFASVSQFLTESSDEVAQCLQWRSPDLATPTTTSTVKRKRVKKQEIEKDEQPMVDTKKPKTTLSTSSPNQSETRVVFPKPTLPRSKSFSPPNLPSRDSVTYRLRPIRRHSIDHSNYSITFEGTERGQETVPDLDKECSEGAVCRRSLRNRVVVVPSLTDNYGLRPRNGRLLSRERTKLGTKEGDENREIIDESTDLNVSFREKRKHTEGHARLASQKTRKRTRTSSLETLSENDLSSKKDELLQLKENRTKIMKQRKYDIKQSLKGQRANDRKVLREKKIKERVELKLVAREKLRRARSLLKDAQRAKRVREKEEEKERRRAELRGILNKKREERKRRKLMTSLRGVVNSRPHSNVPLIDDTPQACVDHGVPSLPSLAPLDVGVADHLVPTFLCVCEFLHNFTTPLKLRKSMTSATLAALLKNEKGMADLCWTLLKALAHDYEDLSAELKGPKRGKNIEELIHRHLERSNKNGLTNTDHILLNEGLIILDHLCDQLLDTSLIVEYLEKGGKEEEELRRKLRLQEQEKTREMREALRELCEEGSSMESIEVKRNEFASELCEMRAVFKRKVSRCASRHRIAPLGRDRFDRFYWNLQSVDGLIVEGEQRRSWEKISTDEELKSMKGSLWSNGVREHSLLTSLGHTSLYPPTESYS